MKVRFPVLAASLTLTTAGFAQETGGAEDEIASLLPDPDPGWRTERMSFPLSFAPDLEYEGFEDLLFAPGMFTPASDSFWSYAFAIEVHGDQPLDRAFVRTFLESYYRGLCDSVGRQNGLDLDLGKFHVEVDGGAGSFSAVIQTFDAFVTGEPLRLRLELAGVRDPRAGTIELLGLASPMNAEAEVWGSLHGIGEKWATARRPALGLNHLFLVPDLAAYEALRDSEFLAQTFGVHEERTTVRRDLSYTGLYWYGQNTYFEFLESGSLPGYDGASGIALGVEIEGGLALLQGCLARAELSSMPSSVDRDLDGRSIPWFEMLGLPGVDEPSGAPLSFFVMEYRPEFLARWDAPEDARPGDLDRAAVLSRYAAHLDQKSLHTDGLFLDADRIEVTLARDEAMLLRKQADALGLECRVSEAGMQIRGPGFELEIRPGASSLGITAFETSLRREVESRTLEFGEGLRLVLVGRRARWETMR